MLTWGKFKILTWGARKTPPAPLLITRQSGASVTTEQVSEEPWLIPDAGPCLSFPFRIYQKIQK